MSLLEASSLADASLLRADICIVGAGAAGLALAVELAASRLDVLLLESGGLHGPSAAADVECTGLPLVDPTPRRAQGFGGSTGIWYGRLARLDESDFAPRSWVASSGWPIAPAEVYRFEPGATRFFALETDDAFSRGPSAIDSIRADLDGGSIVAERHVWPRRIHVAELHLPVLRAASNVRVVLGARLTHLTPAPAGGVIEDARARAGDGRRLTIRARAYVLACGGWENPRLLLLSRDAGGVAAGNRHDVVGRYYLNHPRCDGAARLVPSRAHPRRAELLRALTESRWSSRGMRTQIAFAVEPRRRQQEGLLNAASFFYPVPATGVRRLAEGIRRLGRRAPAAEDARRPREPLVAAAAPAWVEAAAHALARTPLVVDHLAVVDQVEQVPDPESRILLGDKCDRFGAPLARLHWVVGADTTRSLRRLHELLAEQAERSGWGRLESAFRDPAYEPRYLDAAHPAGTTRMSADPRTGVVDAQCRVHGVENLWIAGSSVFPTSGQAAPTWTIVCLALRLAAELRQRLESPGVGAAP